MGRANAKKNASAQLKNGEIIQSNIELNFYENDVFRTLNQNEFFYENGKDSSQLPEISGGSGSRLGGFDGASLFLDNKEHEVSAFQKLAEAQTS